MTSQLTALQRRSLLGCLALVATLPACRAGEESGGQSQDVAPTAAPDPTAEILATADSIIAAFGRQDSVAYFSRFAPEASFTFHSTPQRLHSRAEYEAEWQSWKPAGFVVRGCRSSDQRVQLLGDVAVFTHAVQTDVTTNEGDSTLRERETIVFQRHGDRWIAIHEHLSPDPNP